jgi:prepilin-type N-terminal cleavage/methylation domain-containing protein
MLRRGFTLLEVLVGIAILALAVVVLGAAYVNTLGAHAAVAQRATAGEGMDYLREAVLAEPDRRKVEAGGRMPLPEDRDLSWVATVEAAAVPDLFRVVVRGRITGGRDGSEEAFEQKLMLLRPDWSEPDRREQVRADWARTREGVTRP